MPQKTALYGQHEKLGGRIVDFHGWLLPIQYSGIPAEHLHCRTAVVVFDTSHMGQFLIGGAGCAESLSRVCTQNASKLPIGACRYGFLLNDNAGVIDDTILMRLADDEFLLVVNAGTAAADLAWLTQHISGLARIENLSARGWGKIDVQGPLALRALVPLTGVDLRRMAYFTVARGKCCGLDCVISRTGYTGELGYEIMAPGADISRIFASLLSNESVRPAGLGCRDSLRMEMCYPLFGNELGPDRDPVGADLARFVPLDHEFIGSNRIAERVRNGTAQKLVAFSSSSRSRASAGNPILADNKTVGIVTSGAFSPSLQVSIGMGYVATGHTAPGSVLAIDTGRARLPVAICEKPIWRKGTCRTTPGE